MRFAFALAGLMLSGSPDPVIPAPTIASPEVEIWTVTESDLALTDAAPRFVMTLKRGEYAKLVSLVRSRGRVVTGNYLRYGFRDSMGNAHELTTTYKPSDVPVDSARTMEINVEVNSYYGVPGEDKYKYVITERHVIEYHCVCPDTTAEKIREQHIEEIKEAVKQLLDIEGGGVAALARL